MQAGILLAFLLLAFLLPAIPQPESYHAFADTRTLLGVPNFWNTMSNLPFLAVGIAGIRALAREGSAASVRFREPEERQAYLAFFAGVFLTGLGSSYYHLAPDAARLVWDRLPIALISGGLVVAILGDYRKRGDERIGSHHRVDHAGVSTRSQARRKLSDLVATLVLSAATVVYWALSGPDGTGNLTPYLLLQAYVVIAVVVILLAGTSRYTRRFDVVTVIGFYGLARAAEWLDAKIYSVGHLLSGHTLKHLFAALATAWLLRMILSRSTTAPGTPEPARTWQ